MSERNDPFTAYADEPCIEGGVHHPYTAYNQGWDARCAGAPPQRNPYAAGTREQHWWDMGWCDADDDYRDDPEHMPTPPTMRLGRHRWRMDRVAARTTQEQPEPESRYGDLCPKCDEDTLLFTGNLDGVDFLRAECGCEFTVAEKEALADAVLERERRGWLDAQAETYVED